MGPIPVFCNGKTPAVATACLGDRVHRAVPEGISSSFSLGRSQSMAPLPGKEKVRLTCLRHHFCRNEIECIVPYSWVICKSAAGYGAVCLSWDLS